MRAGFFPSVRVGSPVTWDDLFERAADHETTVEEVRAALSARRSDD